MPGYRLDCGVSRQHNGMTALLLPLFTLNQIESNQLEGAVEVGCRLIKALWNWVWQVALNLSASVRSE